MRDEGVIKFHCDWIKTEAAAESEIEALNHCRNTLFRYGLIGVYSDGIGFGNISARIKATDQFWISGTQTGHLEQLSACHYARVTKYSLEENRVTCEGPVKASSESLTHAMIYAMDAGIHAIVHVHHSKLWQTLKYQVPTTAESVPYGTPEMAAAVRYLYQHEALRHEKLLVMAGHEDGLISFGSTVEEAFDLMVRRWKQVVS